MNRKLYLIFNAIQLVLSISAFIALTIFAYFKFASPISVTFPSWFVVAIIIVFCISLMFYCIADIFFNKYMKEERK